MATKPDDDVDELSKKVQELDMAGSPATTDNDDLSSYLTTERHPFKWNGSVHQLENFLKNLLPSELVNEYNLAGHPVYQFDVHSPKGKITFFTSNKTLQIQGTEENKEKIKAILKQQKPVPDNKGKAREDGESSSSTGTKSAMKGSTATESEDIESKQADINVKKKEISEARSLALQFMSKNPSCIRAIPYESEDLKSLTMCLYMDANGEGIPDEIKTAARRKLKPYEPEFVDLPHRRLSKISTPLPTSETQKGKELADITRTIEENLNLFEDRMNVTAVQASYKVTASTEKIPCVRVYVVGRGKIPAGETDINEIKKDLEKDHPLKDIVFDVAEGYHKLTTGSSLEGYTWPLEGGVGIGVEGVHAAGTLGGFLEDEKGKVYILSNEHVLHPPNAGNIIVQPSLYDYENMREEATNNMNEWTDKLRNIPKGIEENNEDIRSRLVRRMQQKIQNTGNILSDIEQNPRRQIGTYANSLKENFKVNENRKIYVDAAIATLNENEQRAMTYYKTHIEEDQINRCPLYGFETNKYWKTEDYKPPNGEIIDFTTFQESLHKDGTKLRFMKIGRTTGFTDEGFVDLPNEELFLRCISYSTDFPGCMLNAYYQEYSFWARNCFSLRKRGGSFSTKGDSGSLVFDKNGRALGMVFGMFNDVSKQFTYSLISPLCVTVDALKDKAGLKKLRLWRIPNNEGSDDEEPSHET